MKTFTSQSRIKRVSEHKITITPIPIPLYTPLQMLIPLSTRIAPEKKRSGFLIHTSGVQKKRELRTTLCKIKNMKLGKFGAQEFNPAACSHPMSIHPSLRVWRWSLATCMEPGSEMWLQNGETRPDHRSRGQICSRRGPQGPPSPWGGRWDPQASCPAGSGQGVPEDTHFLLPVTSRSTNPGFSSRHSV